jgi:hypothetical protein
VRRSPASSASARSSRVLPPRPAADRRIRKVSLDSTLSGRPELHCEAHVSSPWLLAAFGRTGQVPTDGCAFNHLSGVLKKGGLNAELLRIVLNGDEWLSYIENWRHHDGTTAVQVHTYDQDGCLKKRRVKIGPTRTQPARISAGDTTAGSTTMASKLAPYTASPGSQPAQNGDGGQPAQDDQPARTAEPGTTDAAAA